MNALSALSWLKRCCAAPKTARRLFGAGVVAASLGMAVVPPALAQDTPAAGSLGFGIDNMQRPDKKAPMVLESDQLVYDYDGSTVSAVGRVKIYYDGYTLEADKVIYNQKTKKMNAVGAVKIVDRTGSVATADSIDITQDFADGFVQSLKLDTPTQTHFAAERAYRRGGKTTTFYRGVYTACEPCLEHPEKKPIWQVKAARIIVDHSEHLVYFKQASLEFLGIPVAYFPAFSAPDPTIKRKSGFLYPAAGYKSSLGAYLKTPYFWALAPNYDVTFSPSVYTNQGFLADVEWRHRLENGQYTLEMAGIDQLNPGSLYDATKRSSGDTNFRGGVRTTGEFYLNQQWTFGWDATLLSDRTFSRDYDLFNTNSSVSTSTVHLTGMSARNYLDLRGYYFQQLDDNLDARYDQGRQPLVAPVLDYNHIFDSPVLGGEMSIKANVTHLSRSETDYLNLDGSGSDPIYHPTLTAGDRVIGLEGDYTRTSIQTTWQKSVIGPLGMVFKPFVYSRTDLFSLDENAVAAAIAGVYNDGNHLRSMPAAGVEWRWPIMMSGMSSSFVFEPIAQVIVRPDEQLAGYLPNEDAQSLVFDDSNLFTWDKFSGYDRVEGGTRVNVGFHYLATIGAVATVQGNVGQSYQVAGLNSFSVDDMTGTGLVSGLQDNVSDYVAGATLDTGAGYFLTARGRFDHDNLNVNRAELTATGKFGQVTASASYVYLRDQPAIGYDEPTNTISSKASWQFTENWRVFGSVAWDIHADQLASSGVGLAYDDECTTFSVTYSSVRENYTDLSTTKQFLVNLQLRTLGGTQLKSDVGNN